MVLRLHVSEFEGVRLMSRVRAAMSKMDRCSAPEFLSMKIGDRQLRRKSIIGSIIDLIGI